MHFPFDYLKKSLSLCMTTVCTSLFMISPSADEITAYSASEINALKSMILNSKAYYSVEYDVLDYCMEKNKTLYPNDETTKEVTTEITETSEEPQTTEPPSETTEEQTTTAVTTERQPKPDVDYLTFGIDVSVHQGAIDWEQVKNDGVEYAILRAGYGKYTSQIDKKFETNYARCKSLGIPVGAYWYSYAQSAAEAAIEADAFIYALKGKTFEYPVYFDIEDPSQTSLSRQTLTDITDTFCQKLEDAGYYVGIYTNVYWTENLLYQSQLTDYDKWLAHWTSKPKYGNSFGGMWQYGAYGSVTQVENGQATMYGQINGITAACDVNVCYRDYPSLIKSKHFNGY